MLYCSTARHATRATPGAPSSSGPGRRPLKAVAPVRIRSGLQSNGSTLFTGWARSRWWTSAFLAHGFAALPSGGFPPRAPHAPLRGRTVGLLRFAFSLRSCHPGPARPGPSRPIPARPGPSHPGPAPSRPAHPGPAYPGPAPPIPVRPVVRVWARAARSGRPTGARPTQPVPTPPRGSGAALRACSACRPWVSTTRPSYAGRSACMSGRRCPSRLTCLTSVCLPGSAHTGRPARRPRANPRSASCPTGSTSVPVAGHDPHRPSWPPGSGNRRGVRRGRRVCCRFGGRGLNRMRPAWPLARGRLASSGTPGGTGPCCSFCRAGRSCAGRFGMGVPSMPSTTGTVWVRRLWS